MEKKQSSIIHIRSWVRTNGEMSEDGKSITYSCAELESVIREAKAMHKEEIVNTWTEATAPHEIGLSDTTYILAQIKKAEQYYTNIFGGNNE